jgi:hypothetical protein
MTKKSKTKSKADELPDERRGWSVLSIGAPRETTQAEVGHAGCK